MNEDPGLSPETVIRRAAAAGYSVSMHQITRWRKRGIFKLLRKIGLGRGIGSESFYPTGTDELVIELCKALEKDRRLDLAAVALFFQGYAVSSECILKILRKELKKLKSDLNGIVDEDGLTPTGWNELPKLVTSRLRSQSLSRARKRIKSSGFETFIFFLMYFAIGQEFYIPIHDSDAVTDQDHVIEGLGLEKAQETWLDQDPSSLITEISSLAGRANIFMWEEVLETMTDVELKDSRRILLMLWQLPQDASAISQLIFEDDRLGLEVLPDINVCEPNRQAASILLVLLCLKRLPVIATKIQELSETAEYTSWLRHDMENNPDIDQILKMMRTQLND